MSTEIPHGRLVLVGTAAPEEEAVIDVVPAAVRDAAKRAFALRDRGALVLELVSDSLLDDLTYDGPRELRFGAPDQPTRVTVRVLEDEPGMLLHLEAGQARVIEIQLDDGVLGVQELDGGRWTAPLTGHGLLSVVVEAGQQRARTAWLRL